MPRSVTPTHGKMGTKSLLGGGRSANPTQASHRVLNAGASTTNGSISTIVAAPKQTKGLARKNSAPSSVAAAIAWRIPKKMKLSGKANQVTSVMTSA